METTSPTQLLSSEECLQILKKDFQNFKIKSYKIIKQSNELVGFMGEYHKLLIEVELNGEEDKQLSYFIKCVPLHNEFHREECERKGFFTKETKIYESILPNIQRYAQNILYPKCYYTRKDLLVLEDLSRPEKRLRHLKDIASYTMDHFYMFLKHLADLHSASIAWEVEEHVNIGEQFKNDLYELQLITTNEWYLTGIKGIIFLAQQNPLLQYAEALEFVNTKLLNILMEMHSYTEPSTSLRNVLCHRDSWDRNILFEYNEQDELKGCRIVDFQLTRYSPPAIDVLYFLYNNLPDMNDRKRLVPKLLDFYYEQLQRNLKYHNLAENLITRADFTKDCQSGLLPVLVLRAICEPLMQLPKGWAQEMREKEAGTFDAYMNAERSEMFLRVSKIDDSYMEKIQFTIQELLEYFGYKAME